MSVPQRRDMDHGLGSGSDIVATHYGCSDSAVAALLVSQLRQQHKDVEREILYNGEPRTSPICSVGLSIRISVLFEIKGRKISMRWRAMSNVSSEILCYSLMTTQAVNFRAGHEGLDRGIDSRSEAQTKGM